MSNEELWRLEAKKLRAEGNKLLHDTMKQLIAFPVAAATFLLAMAAIVLFLIKNLQVG